MQRAALVMGFGFGQANVDIAKFASERNNTGRFNCILSQAAVCQPLRALGLDSAPMNGHHIKVYVDTLDAVGFGLLKLKELLPEEEPVEVEVIAHDLQLQRAHNAATLAIEYLSRRPGVAAFLQHVTLPDLTAPCRMEMNGYRESWRQPWTCNSLLYVAFNATLIRGRFNHKKNEYAIEGMYNNLARIQANLHALDVHWTCTEVP